MRAAAQAGSLPAWQVVQVSGAPVLAVEVGPRDAKAVIVARVDHHVGLRRHVAVDALAAGLARACGNGAPACRRRWAGGTGRRPRCPRRAAAGCAARGSWSRSRRPDTSCSAGTSRSCRPRRRSGRRRDRGRDRAATAGSRRAAAGRSCGRRRSGERRAWQGAQTSVSVCARQGRHALGDPRTFRERPLALAAVVQQHGQALAWGRSAPRLRPGDVARARPVAGLAGHVERRPGGMVAVRLQVIAAPQIGRVAVGAHPVPVLVDPCPMQLVVVRDLLVGIEMKPALAALLLRPRIPGQAQRLEAPARKRDQILLQRVDAERVVDPIVVQRPVGAFGLGSRTRRPCGRSATSRRTG